MRRLLLVTVLAVAGAGACGSSPARRAALDAGSTTTTATSDTSTTSLTASASAVASTTPTATKVTTKPATTSSTGTARAEPTTARQPAHISITVADSGKTFTLHRIDTATLSLTDGHRWDPPTVKGSSIRLDATTTPTSRGAQVWTVQPIANGTSDISATGGANCAPSEPCPMYAILFDVTITVVD
jgi:hypothetical protein